MNPTIKEKVVAQMEVSDLDLVIIDRLLGRNDEGHDYEWVTVPHKFNWIDNDRIPIDLLQQTIDDLKSLGANHVRIEPHCDHHGYYFSGVNLEVMTKKELMKHKKNELDYSLKQLKNSLEHNKEKSKSLKEDIKVIENKIGEILIEKSNNL